MDKTARMDGRSRSVRPRGTARFARHTGVAVHVLAAVALARLQRDRLILVGATPTAAEIQYGWIERGKPRGS